MHDDIVIPVSIFDNAADKQPKPYQKTWQWLSERLCRYEERNVKDGKAWSPVTYKPGATRGKQNVEFVHALVMDVDHSDLPRDLLTGRELVAHNTHSSTPEAPRWRAILPLTRPVSGEDWPAFWLRAQAHFGGCIDPATKDASRLFYLPSCPPGVQHTYVVQHGDLLEPDSLPEVPVYTPPPAPRGGHKKPVLGRYLADWAARFTLDRCSGLATMGKDTGRNDACNRLAYLLGGLAADPIHDLREAWVVERLLDACVSNGLINDDGERSVNATIQSGLESGLLRPWSPSDQDPLLPTRKYEAPAREPVLRVVNTDELRLDIVRMSEVKAEAIRWLWKGRLARGKLALVMGDPGLGKSLITHWLSALVSTGGEWPDGGQCEQGAAIVFSIEDALADTVRPRLEAAGAEMSRVIAVRGVVDPKATLDEKLFALDEHIHLLEQLIAEEDASLVIMDPISAYLGANVNSHKEADVRRVLGPLSMMAERTGVAILMVIHLNKGKDIAALNRATGSVAFPAVSRIVLGVMPDPLDEDNKRRLLLPLKCNIARLPPGLGYRIESAPGPIAPRPGDDEPPPILVWDNDPALEDAAQALDRGTVTERNQTEETVLALRQIFLDSGGERIPATTATRQLRDAGASTAGSTLTNAKKQLGIRSILDPQQRTWFWHAPKNITSPRAHAQARGSAGAREYGPAESPNVPTRPTQPSQPNPVPSATSVPSADSLGSTSVHARAYARDEMRYCVHCMRNLASDIYDAHLPCPEQVIQQPIVEECPVHHLAFDAHDCDQL